MLISIVEIKLIKKKHGINLKILYFPAFAFLSIGWGLISDIDIESERLRAIGGQRFTVWSVAR